MDEKAAHPPSYPQGQPVAPQMTGGQYPQGAYPPPQGYYPTQTPQAGMPGYPQMAPVQAPMHTGGYPAQPQVIPQQTVVQVQPDLGSQYQQQLFARCARGDHDVVVRYGPCGIIAAIVFFPIGLIFLFLDVERKCARCGANLG